MADDALAVDDGERARIWQAGNRARQHGVPVACVAGRTAQSRAGGCDLRQRGIERRRRLLHVGAQEVDEVARASFGFAADRAIPVPGLKRLHSEQCQCERDRCDDDPALQPVVRYLWRHRGGGRARLVHEGKWLQRKTCVRIPFDPYHDANLRVEDIPPRVHRCRRQPVRRWIASKIFVTAA
ncbi:MAG: hypothetical protein H0V72_20975 [Bradyrhizobium sp.]|nr:hypothetical protein [Bradyrhizobium sp.]